MGSQFRPAILMLLLFTVTTGLVYPVALTAVARVVFPHQAGGSLIVQNERSVGSELIGQPFDDPRYFWGRPSATDPYPYHAAASTGTNLGPTNKALLEAVEAQIRALRAADPSNIQPVPVDLITASASGLDPHISPAAALYQVPRVARTRGVSEGAVAALVRRHIEGRQLGVLGQPRVNVLLLNRALESLRP